MTGPNLLFVCVDCLRGDFVGSDRSVTPFVDGLVDGGAHYTDMYATTTTTTPSVASFMTGLYSERNGVHALDEGRVRPDVDTLAEVLSENGYDTHALVTGPIVEDTGIDRGFDEYRYRDRREKLIGEWGETAREYVRGLEPPFFCYVHLWELHKPVEVPGEFDEPRFGDRPYARALSALDPELDALADATPDDTAIAVHGDHGESIHRRESPFRKAAYAMRALLRYTLGIDTRGIERRLNRRFETPGLRDHYLEDGHGENVYDFTANVPFVLSAPDVPPTRIGAQCRQVDVFPTLLDALGVDPGDGLDGETLLPPGSVEDRDAYIRACGRSLLRRKNWARGLRADGTKYVEYPERDWGPELYDLADDPNELRPVDDPDRAREMARRLPTEQLTEGERLEIDELLEDLGYA